MTDAEIVKLVQGWFRETTSKESFRSWIKRAKTGFQFRIGQQWDAETKEQLDAEGRPAITINKILPVINVLAGTQRDHREVFKVMPRKGSIREVAEILTETMGHAMDMANGPWKFSQMFEDGTTCGKGWVGFDIDHRYDPLNGDLGMSKPSPFHMIEDELCLDYDMNEHGRFVMRKYRWTLEDIILAFPKKERELKKGEAGLLNMPDLTAVSDYDDSHMNDYNREEMFAEAIAAEKDKPDIADKKLVLECWWRKWENYSIICDTQTMTFKRVPKENLAMAIELVGGSLDDRFRIVERVIPVLNVAWICGNMLLMHQEDPFDGVSLYPYIRFCPYWVDGHVMGVIDNIVDPQRELNKRRSQALHHLNMSANSGWVADDNVTSDWSVLETFGSKPGVIIKKRPGSHLERVEPTQLSQGHVQLGEMGDEDIKHISGVNSDWSGTTQDPKTSGRAIMLRKQAGLIITASIFDNYEYTLKIGGDTLIVFIQKTPIYSPEEIQMLIDERQLTVPPEVIKQLHIGRYAATVSFGADSPTVRMMNYLTLLEARESGIPVPAKILIDASDLPKKDEVIAAIEQAEQQQMEMAMQQQMIEAAGRGGPARASA